MSKILDSMNTYYKGIRFCPNNVWSLPEHFECSTPKCPMVQAVLDYARDNLVMFNIFIKVS